MIPYNPYTWHWLVGDDESRAWSSAAGAWVTSWDDERLTRIEDLTGLDEVLRRNGFVSCLVTADDIRAECQRRIVARVGARSFEDCTVKQLNALMRSTELTNMRVLGLTLSPVELAEAAALGMLADDIKALREKSNAFSEPYPVDYRDDKHW